jgi:hypothetical protein
MTHSFRQIASKVSKSSMVAGSCSLELEQQSRKVRGVAGIRPELQNISL